MSSRPLRVCFFGTYREEYSRNRILIDGLRCAGVEVIECHERLWHGIEDRVQAASGGWLNPAFAWRLLRTYLRLLRWHARMGDYDALVIGYPGQLDVFLGRILSWRRRKPMAWDIFMSIYLISIERGLDKRSPLTIQLLGFFERLACTLPDLLILDTREYVAWFQAVHHLSSDKFRLVPTGADDQVYHPVSIQQADGGIFRVVYYGTFIPNHGVETIVRAAHILAGEHGIQFEMIGNGPDQEMAQNLARDLGLTNITFIDWMPETDLVMRIAQSDVCLGAFGTTPQSIMTVQNKIYSSLAMAKPVITGDSPAIRQAFKDKEHLLVCERANPESLAAAIKSLELDPDLRNRLGQNGYALFTSGYTTAKLGALYKNHLEGMVRAK
ncbi:MAG: glycosyltransferase family 4 protein [Omnitrophica WOR_2 bacterium]